MAVNGAATQRTQGNARWQAVMLAVIAVTLVAVIVAASLYKFIGHAVQSFTDDIDSVNQQVAFAFGLFMPLLAYGSFRRARFTMILAVQGSAAAVWIVILIGAFLPPGGILGLVSIILVSAYLVAIALANVIFSFTTSWIVKGIYAAIAVACTAIAFTIYAAEWADSRAAEAVTGVALAVTVLFGVASYVGRSVETASANAAVFGSRLPSVFYFWGGTLYFAIAVLALPLTLLVDRPFPDANISVPLYVVLGVSLLFLAVLVILLKLRRLSGNVFSILVIANIIVGCATSLLTNDAAVFLDSADRLLPLGVYLVVTFMVVIVFSAPVVVSRPYAVVRNVLSWYAASILGIALIVISTHSENAMADSFMHVDTFIIFAFMLAAGAQLGALLFMLAGSIRARHANPKPVVNPNQPQVEER